MPGLYAKFSKLFHRQQLENYSLNFEQQTHLFS